jgi:hypothetical protein
MERPKSARFGRGSGGDARPQRGPCIEFPSYRGRLQQIGRGSRDRDQDASRLRGDRQNEADRGGLTLNFRTDRTQAL